MEHKKLLSVAVIAVMLFAGFIGIVGDTESSHASSDAQVAELPWPMVITAGGADYEALKLCKATYDEKEHILTFNENIKIVGNYEEPNPLIDIQGLGDITIVFNANVTFTCMPKEEIVFIDAGNARLTIRGSGTVTFDFPYTQEVEIFNRAIFCTYLDIEDVSISILLPDLNGSVSRNGAALIQAGYHIGITGASIFIDASKSFTRNNYWSLIDAQVGSIVVTNSTIDILMPTMENYRLYGIYCKYDFILTNSRFTAKSPGVIYDRESETACIIVKGGCKFVDSYVDIDLKCGGTKYYAIQAGQKGMEIDSSIVKIKMDGSNEEGREAVNVSGYGYFRNSNIIVSAPEYIVGLSCSAGLRIESSDVNSHGKTYALSGSIPYTIVSADKILASDGKTEPTEEVETANDHPWVHVVGIFKVNFDLGLGTGKEIGTMSIHTGDTVVLPECDATWEGNKFIGWTDGYHLYQPGYKYNAIVGVTFTALYEGQPGPVPPVPPEKTTDSTMLVVCCVAIALAAVGVAAISRR